MTEHHLIDRLCERLGAGQGARTGAVVQTHVSWVILAGDLAYKLKKPLKNPFLDYSTLGLRREACQKEWVLNRRYAPELYLAVVAIVEGASGLDIVECSGADGTLGEVEGKVVEYAVKMQRFPDDALLRLRLERGQVSPSDIDELARCVAAFHLEAERVAVDSPWGVPEEVARAERDNLSLLAGSPLPDSARDSIRALDAWSQHHWQRLAPRMADRRRTGWIRACHGDLHLENIIRWNGRMMPFDGIEFSERLRWIDVQSDAAFVAMDLVAHDHAELANRFLSAYVESTGDYQGLAVQRWYQVYRALVRAKVAVLRAEQESDDEARHEDLNRAAHKVWTAEQIRRPEPPRMWITYGVSGSGKTVGSQRWVDRRAAIRVRSDLERRRLRDAPDDAAPAAADRYSPEAVEAVYRQLEWTARVVIEAGYSVVVDATFLARHRRDRFRRTAEELGVPLGILAFEAPREELERRLRQRNAQGHDASEADVEVMETQLRNLEPLGEEERALVEPTIP